MAFHDTTRPTADCSSAPLDPTLAAAPARQRAPLAPPVGPQVEAALDWSTDDDQPDDPLDQALLLDVFAEPILYNRAYVDVAGSVTGAVYLSYAMKVEQAALEQAEVEQRPFEGWFCKSQADWQAETGLTRAELDTARRKLRDCGVLEERKAGSPLRVHMRIDHTRLTELLQVAARRRWAAVLANRQAV